MPNGTRLAEIGEEQALQRVLGRGKLLQHLKIEFLYKNLDIKLAVSNGGHFLALALLLPEEISLIPQYKFKHELRVYSKSHLRWSKIVDFSELSIGICTPKFSPDGNLLCINAQGFGRHFRASDFGGLFRASDGHVLLPPFIHFSTIRMDVSPPAFSPDGSLIAFGIKGMSRNTHLHIKRVDNGETIWTYSNEKIDWISELAFTPDGRIIVINDYDHTTKSETTRFVEIENEEEIGQVPLRLNISHLSRSGLLTQGKKVWRIASPAEYKQKLADLTFRKEQALVSIQQEYEDVLRRQVLSIKFSTEDLIASQDWGASNWKDWSPQSTFKTPLWTLSGKLLVPCKYHTLYVPFASNPSSSACSPPSRPANCASPSLTPSAWGRTLRPSCTWPTMTSNWSPARPGRSRSTSSSAWPT
jgi:WD40 repeat protein